MDANRDIAYRFHILRVLALAETLKKNTGLNCISTIVFFAALVRDKECSLYNTLIKKGFSREKILYASAKMISNFVDISTKQTEMKDFSFPLVGFSVKISKEVDNLFSKAEEFVKTKFYNVDEIGCNELLYTFIELYPDVYEYFLDSCGLTITPNNIITKEEKAMIIPRELSGFVTILNNEPFANDPVCDVLGRDGETLKLMRILAKSVKRNAVLVGDPGVGKTALVEALTWMITTENCPEVFKNSVVVSLDVNSIIAGTHFRGDAEQRFVDLIAFLENHPECILFIDEVHTILGAGACVEGEMDLANSLKPILAKGKTQVIGATTIAEYEKYFAKDGALKRRFEKVFIKEPKVEEVFPMIKNKISRLTKEHNVNISDELVHKIIFYAACFNYETKNPDRSLDLIDKAMAIAELDGRNEVIEQDILDNFDTNRHIYDKTPLNIKMAIAAHEAGHCIVNYFSNELINRKLLAVSIMPADDYYGVNVFDAVDDVIPSNTLNYFIQLIGSKLGGRIAEKMYSDQLSAGAHGDLSAATKMASDVVTKYGLIEEFTQNRVYFDGRENPMFSSEVVNKANPAIDKVLSDAWDYAEKLLTEKRIYLDILVEMLLAKGMLSAEEINELFSGINTAEMVSQKIKKEFLDKT